MENNTFTTFIDRLVEEKGLTNLDTETLNEVKADLSKRLERRIDAEVLRAMPPDKLEEFDRLLDQDSDEALQSFCQQNIKDYDQVIASALLGFRNTYLGI